MIPSATTADAGRMIGRRYRLRSAVGRGGMGTVWLAEDVLLGRAVAVKEVHLPPGLPEHEREELRHRLLREARVAARLDHPSAVTVFDVVEEDGWPYIVMEFVRASTLDEVIRAEGPLPPPRVAAIGLDVLGALEAAHAAGIVHRDVKPANIMIRDDGRVTLTDFGIATSSGESSLTSTGLLLGSPSYIAPERARGQVPGPPSDLWSLGATLYTAVEGHAPFERGEPFLTLAAVTSEAHAPFERAGPLAEVIDGLLAREPSERLNASAARGLLRAVASAVPPVPAEPTPDATPLTPREPGARTTALPWSDVIAAAASDPSPPAAADSSSAPLAAAAAAALAAAAARPAAAPPVEAPAPSAAAPPVDADAHRDAAPPAAAATRPEAAPAWAAEDPEVASVRAAEGPDAAPAWAAERPDAVPAWAAARPEAAPAAERPEREASPEEERRAPVLVPVRAPEAEDARGGPVPPGTLPAAGPRRGRGLGLVLGLVVLLLAAFAVERFLQGGTAAGEAEVAATVSPVASAPATLPASENPQAVAPDPASSTADGEDSSGPGSGEDSSGPGSGEDSSGEDSSGEGSGEGSDDADEDAAAPPSEEPEQNAAAPDATAVPADFASYTSDEFGWTVRHPPGWQVVPLGDTRVDFRDPGSGRYLRVDTSLTPGESALGDWQRYEPSFRNSHANYQQIRMEQVAYRDFADAADWEYTYTSSSGNTLHAVNRGFVLNDRSQAYALNFQTRDADWEGSRELYDQMAASFQP